MVARRPWCASRAVQLRTKALRQTETPSEVLLWALLRRRTLGGLMFRRQHPVGRRIADFCCAEAKLVVEVDGGIHECQVERDADRTAYLEGRGYRVLRFTNAEVASDPAGLLGAIVRATQGADLPLATDYTE